MELGELTQHLRQLYACLAQLDAHITYLGLGTHADAPGHLDETVVAHIERAQPLIMDAGVGEPGQTLVLTTDETGPRRQRQRL